MRLVLLGLCLGSVASFLPSPHLTRANPRIRSTPLEARTESGDLVQSLSRRAACLGLGIFFSSPFAAFADGGASLVENSKIREGGASTINNQRGARKTITRGVQLDRSDFAGDDLSGVSFQQSQVRGGNFKGSRLAGTSFFDATLDDSDLEGAYMNQANLEMASLANCNLKNAVITESYVTGATSFEGANIEGADFTDTFLRKDQKKYLCERAKGTNPTTGVDTAESLMCQ
eukprot:CAMPEP_0172585592 /NCGR_PEP_ID=MMETSP1068-20121228/5003_1 /TAXON_ID=35684 /ORGANISM="Pseudopedinella elastica, Strain CCMP716" /LENGTH=230 /DNA_ID=CAMNT_0013380111 /DNA_START=107 /DNA_END=799 /DNA_ORIENTATION=+